MGENLKAKAEHINSLTIKGQKIIKFAFASMAVAFVLPIILTFVFVAVKSKTMENIAMYSFLFIFVWAFVEFKFIFPKGNALKKESDYIYKSSFIPEMVNEFLEGATYQFNRGLTKKDVEAAALFHVADLDVEDYIAGSYMGVNFEESDVRSYTREAGSNKRKVVFKGRMFVIDTPFSELDSVKIYSDLLAIDTRICKEHGEEVKLESEAFNKRFKVFANNPADAFYILTPQIQEVFMRLKEDYAAWQTTGVNSNVQRSFNAHFIGGKVYILIEGDMRAFEQITFPFDYDKEYKKIKKDASVVKDVIESMKLGA